jgi:hypothetical protein
MVPLVERLVTQMPVVLASRVGVGEVLTHAYRYPGSEIELMALGTIRARRARWPEGPAAAFPCTSLQGPHPATSLQPSRGSP